MSVLILDYGSQFTQLIARRVREAGVYSEIKPGTLPRNSVDLSKFGAVILSGGPADVDGADAPNFDTAWLEIDKPILGVCYGMQLIAHHLGGKVQSAQDSREYGKTQFEVTKAHTLFDGVTSSQVWMSHGNHISQIPKGFIALGKSPGSPYAAMVHETKPMCAVLFHPEVVHTTFGKEILNNFLFKIAKLASDWKPGNFIEETVERIRKEVPENGQVICALSGGVDSTVAAALVARAVGPRLHCIFVDNGLLRKDEGDKVEAALGKSGLGLSVTRVNAQKEFLSELKGVTDPEQKRKIIGRVFIEIFEKESKKHKGATHLVQGTLYPDVVESVSVRGGPSVTIKSHHNVGGLPEGMNFKLIEPLRELFKDEVRIIGRELGVPETILTRQPFPGPGLAIRVLGEVSEDRLKLLREADNIFLEEIRAGDQYSKLWQSFAILLPIQSVGVMGDGRTYEMTIGLRAVTSEDGMTADWAYLPEELLRRVSGRITNEIRGINRVVMDISSKPPATIEWE